MINYKEVRSIKSSLKYFLKVRDTSNVKLLLKKTASLLIAWVKYFFINIILKNRELKLEETAIISSETRGGSTWLMEMIGSATNSIISWEPLHKKLGVVPVEFEFGDRPFLPIENVNMRYFYFFKDIFLLNRNSLWSTSFVKFSDAIHGEFVLIKFVRANMLIPWLVKNFDFKKKPIYLIRHPIAVVLSQMKNFNVHEHHRSDFKAPNCINNERYIINEKYINSLESEIERRIAIWCINNVEVINHPYFAIKWVPIYYEYLVDNPKEELIKISKIWNMKFNFEKVEFHTPSASANTELAISPINRLQKWITDCPLEQLNKIQGVFDYFNLKIYSTSSAFPIKHL